MVKLILSKPLQALVAVYLHYSYAIEMIQFRAQKPPRDGAVLSALSVVDV